MKSMRNWSLVGVAFISGLLGSLIFNLNSTAIAQEKSPEQPQPQQGQTIEKPKPYGCFKDLRWGMTPDEADKSLGVKLEGWPKKIKGETATYGEMQIGEKKYIIVLHFDSSGLFRVRIEPIIYKGSQFAIGKGALINYLEGSLINSPAASLIIGRVLLDSYYTLKPALVDKFGKPTK